MALEPITEVRGRAVVVPGNDIDTDRIIPARFMKCVTFDGLGRYAFYDARFDEQDRPRAHPLNDPRFEGASILVSGRNFGCGSSREHAPWALADWGLRAIIARSFADIFRNNALKNGLLPIALPADAHETLAKDLERDPSGEVIISLQNQEVTLPDGSKIAFDVDPFAKHLLLNGHDELDFLRTFTEATEAHESKRP